MNIRRRKRKPRPPALVEADLRFDANLQFGLTLQSQKEYPRAIELFRLCVSLGRQTNNPRKTLFAQHALCSALVEVGQIDNAIEAAAEAVAFSEESGSRRLLARSLTDQGVLFRLLGRFEEAAAVLERALKILDPT